MMKILQKITDYTIYILVSVGLILSFWFNAFRPLAPMPEEYNYQNKMLLIQDRTNTAKDSLLPTTSLNRKNGKKLPLKELSKSYQEPPTNIITKNIDSLTMLSYKYAEQLKLLDSLKKIDSLINEVKKLSKKDSTIWQVKQTQTSIDRYQSLKKNIYEKLIKNSYN